MHWILVHWKQMLLRICLTHFNTQEGNQNTFTQLSCPVQLNCEYNYAAKNYLLQHLDNPCNCLLPRVPLGIYIQQEKVTTDSGLLT